MSDDLRQRALEMRAINLAAFMRQNPSATDAELYGLALEHLRAYGDEVREEDARYLESKVERLQDNNAHIEASNLLQHAAAIRARKSKP